MIGLHPVELQKYPVFSIRGGFISIDTSCLQGRIVIR
jgi:hypothetical protein